MKKKAPIIVFLVLFLGLLLLFPSTESYLGSKAAEIQKQSEAFLASIISKQSINPEPLRFFSDAFSSNLTREGVLKYTNIERQKEGIKALKFNAKLNTTAEHKIDDMFAKQYFAHISPEGIGAPELAKAAGYDYIIIGENLALGNFKDDEELVAAWMASPGHRANILTKRYEDIGIAVRKGEFEGKTVWLAVQTFGVPASSCTAIDAGLKKKLDDDKATLTAMEADLQARKAEIDSADSNKQKDYDSKVAEYNRRVNLYNDLVAVTKGLVLEYNNEVKKYNACAEGTN